MTGWAMRTDLFDFELPATNIALRPASPRDSARMLVVQPDGVLRDRTVADLPQWLKPGDQLVVNDTKVISAQLKGRRIGRETEPKIDATLIKRLDGSRWRALVKPAKKLTPGDMARRQIGAHFNGDGALGSFKDQSIFCISHALFSSGLGGRLRDLKVTAKGRPATAPPSPSVNGNGVQRCNVSITAIRYAIRSLSPAFADS